MVRTIRTYSLDPDVVKRFDDKCRDEQKVKSRVLNGLMMGYLEHKKK